MSSFDRLAEWCSRQTGRSVAFAGVVVGLAACVLGGWLAGRFWETIERVSNVVGIFALPLMVLMQNSSNRSTVASHVKDDALIRATPGASDALVALEERCEDEIAERRAALREGRE